MTYMYIQILEIDQLHWLPTTYKNFSMKVDLELEIRVKH
jgi:hypothetical protein